MSRPVPVTLLLSLPVLLMSPIRTCLKSTQIVLPTPQISCFPPLYLLRQKHVLQPLDYLITRTQT